MDLKTKELCILKLLNHILQPTMYDDVRDVAREWVIEENLDKYLVSNYERLFFGPFKNTDAKKSTCQSSKRSLNLFFC